MASEWRDASLGDLIRLQRGHDLTDGQRNAGNIPVMGSAGLNGYHDTSKAKGPGLVIGRSGASFGKVHYSKTDYWPHNTSLYVTDFLGNDELFTFYYLKGVDFSSYNSGSAQPSLNRNHVYLMPVTIPPLPEQKEIAHILGSLDDKIELNRRMNETLEGMAQELFKSWFVDFDPVIDNALEAGNPIPEAFAARAETRRKALADGTANREAAKAFPSAFRETDEMGWIPEGWEPVTFEKLVVAKQGRYLAKNEMEEKPDDSHKYPVWGGNGILGYSKKKAYDKPITLMTCRGSNCGLIKSTKSRAWVSNNSFACTAKYGSEYFIYLYFLSENFSDCVSGSAQPQITYTALKNKQMKSPLSREICEEFSELVQVYRDKQFSNEKLNETLAKLRDTLLPKLISGELRIEDAEKMIGEVL